MKHTFDLCRRIEKGQRLILECWDRKPQRSSICKGSRCQEVRDNMDDSRNHVHINNNGWDDEHENNNPILQQELEHNHHYTGRWVNRDHLPRSRSLHPSQIAKQAKIYRSFVVYLPPFPINNHGPTTMEFQVYHAIHKYVRHPTVLVMYPTIPSFPLWPVVYPYSPQIPLINIQAPKDPLTAPRFRCHPRNNNMSCTTIVLTEP